MEEAGVARPSKDRRVRAAFLLVNDLAMLLLAPQLSDALGVDLQTPAGMAAWASEADRRLRPRRLPRQRERRDMSDDIVRIEGLVKQFGSFRALDGLDLVVRRGEVHGFLGPNGAGKSTTIRILLGLMRRDGGTITLYDRDPWSEGTKLRSDLAYVPGDVSLWPGLTGGECMDILAGVHGGMDPERRAELIERFDLDPTKRARDYSKGNRQKVALVAALASEVGPDRPRRADLGARPPDGAGVPGRDPGAPPSRARRFCCPATSSRRWRRSPTG